MRLFLIIFTFFYLFMDIAHANEKNIWVELNVGSAGGMLGEKVNLKFGDDTSNWAIEFGEYDDFKPFTYVIDRSKGSVVNANANVNVNLTTLAVTKNWNNISKWGYTEVGVGLGLTEGTLAKNCLSKKEVPSTSFFFPHYYQLCDIDDGVRVGIPLHLSAVYGKYLGIGLTVKAFVTNRSLNAGVMLTIPLGDFTK